jgi:hypothetical protein
LARGDKILVKTHPDGIPARDGTTIYSAICTRCVETSTAEEKTILETDEPLEVFNLDTAAVSGDIFAQTGLTLHGTRCVETVSTGAKLIRFEVVAAGPFLGDVTPECDFVTVEVLNVLCEGSGVSIGDEVRVWDPERCHFNIPIEVLIGAVGWAVKMVAPDLYEAFECQEQAEEDGDCRWEAQNLCCTEEIYGG